MTDALTVPEAATRVDEFSNAVLSSLRRTRAVSVAEVLSYVGPGESLIGHGRGGSESLLLFVRRPRGTVVARKVVSERFIATVWPEDGSGVMTPPFRKAQRQVEYLDALPADAAPLFPRILSWHQRRSPVPPGDRRFGARDHVNEVVYDVTYLAGTDVTSFVAHWRPAPHAVARLYEETLRLLRERVHRHRVVARTTADVDECHLRKVSDRLALAHRVAPLAFPRYLTQSETVRVDGTPLLNVGPLLERFRDPRVTQRLEAPAYCLTMGDANTENVRIGNPKALLRCLAADRDFTAEEIELRFVDPRAVGVRTAGATVVDDYLYDAKMWHNSLGRYDAVHGDHAAVRVEADGTGVAVTTLREPTPYDESYAGIDRYLLPAMRDAVAAQERASGFRDADWEARFAFLMGTHFCAMVPFHFALDDRRAISGGPSAQPRPLALFCEGLAWLNATLDVLDGRPLADAVRDLRQPA